MHLTFFFKVLGYSFDKSWTHGLVKHLSSLETREVYAAQVNANNAMQTGKHEIKSSTPP
jgi:hypothetical protein